VNDFWVWDERLRELRKTSWLLKDSKSPTERRKTWCVVDPVERPVEILLVMEQKDFFADERLFIKFTSIELRKTF
jgi:hypothetical protein